MAQRTARSGMCKKVTEETLPVLMLYEKPSCLEYTTDKAQHKALLGTCSKASRKAPGSGERFTIGRRGFPFQGTPKHLQGAESLKQGYSSVFSFQDFSNVIWSLLKAFFRSSRWWHQKKALRPLESRTHVLPGEVPGTEFLKVFYSRATPSENH